MPATVQKLDYDKPKENGQENEGVFFNFREVKYSFTGHLMHIWPLKCASCTVLLFGNSPCWFTTDPDFQPASL